jgi:hypothetical protein
VIVEICEVGPRDGLQNEPNCLPPSVRTEFVNRLTASGLRRIEVVSFVSSDRVPQMAGAEEVVAGLTSGSAQFAALCRSPATKKGRCRLHGGASGSGAPPGERNGQYRHGERTKGAIVEGQKFSALLKTLRAGLR